jgi:hypothetical protein
MMTLLKRLWRAWRWRRPPRPLGPLLGVLMIGAPPGGR